MLALGNPEIKFRLLFGFKISFAIVVNFARLVFLSLISLMLIAKIVSLLIVIGIPALIKSFCSCSTLFR